LLHNITYDDVTIKIGNQFVQNSAAFCIIIWRIFIKFGMDEKPSNPELVFPANEDEERNGNIDNMEPESGITDRENVQDEDIDETEVGKIEEVPVDHPDIEVAQPQTRDESFEIRISESQDQTLMKVLITEPKVENIDVVEPEATESKEPEATEDETKEIVPIETDEGIDVVRVQPEATVTGEGSIETEKPDILIQKVSTSKNYHSS